jgi:hypothetical protein
MINITDYDPIAANQNVEFYFSSIKTLPTTCDRAPIKIGIEFYYKKNKVYVMTYEPTSFLPLATSDLTSSETTFDHNVKTTSSFQVSGTVGYTFTFKSNVAIKTTDSFILSFPKDYFESRYSDYSTVTCPECSKVVVIGLSNLIVL